MRPLRNLFFCIGIAGLAMIVNGCSGASSSVLSTTPQVRLVHVADALTGDTLNLSVDGTEVVSKLAYGQSATSADLTAETVARIVVSDTSGGTTLTSGTVSTVGGVYTFLEYSALSGSTATYGYLELDPNTISVNTSLSGIRFVNVNQNTSASSVTITVLTDDDAATTLATVSSLSTGSVQTQRLAPGTYRFQVKTSDGSSLLLDTTRTISSSTRYTLVFYGGTSSQKFGLLLLTDP